MYQRSFSLCSPENVMLLVVDVQERLMPAVDGADRIAWNIRRLLDAASLLGVPVVVSEQYPKGLGPTLAEIAAALPEGTPVLPKHAFSVCAEESLRRLIDESDAPKVVLCGVEGHVCVLQTAFDLLASGKDVVLAVDACGSRLPRDYEIALRRMESYGVAVATAESILFEWCQTADRPEFKAISRLAKEKFVSAEI